MTEPINARITCQRGSGLSTWSAESAITLGYSQDSWQRERRLWDRQHFWSKVLIDRRGFLTLMCAYVQACVEMAWRDYRGPRDRRRGLFDQSDLVPAVESEFILRQGLRRGPVRSAGAALRARLGGTVRHHQS